MIMSLKSKQLVNLGYPTAFNCRSYCHVKLRKSLMIVAPMCTFCSYLRMTM